MSFSLRWPLLEPQELARTAGSEQIIECIRKHRTVIMPKHDEEKYFERIASYGATKTITITDAALYYGEGRFGEDSSNRDHPAFVTPLIKLRAVVQLDKTNDVVEIAAPVLVSDIERVLRRAR